MSTNHMKDNLRATIGLVKVQWEAKGTEKGQPPVASRIWENSFGCDSHSCVSSRSRFKANCDEQILKQALKRIAMAGSEAGGSSTSRTRVGIPSSPTRTIVDPYGRYCIVFYCIAWYCMVFHSIAWYCNRILDSKQTNSYNCQSLRQVCKTSFCCNIVQSGTIYLNLLLFPNFSKRSQFHICLSIHPEKLRLDQDILNLQWWTFCDSKSMSIEYVEGWVGVSLRGGYDC